MEQHEAEGPRSRVSSVCTPGISKVDLLQITFGANDCEIIRGIMESLLRSAGETSSIVLYNMFNPKKSISIGAIPLSFTHVSLLN